MDKLTTFCFILICIMRLTFAEIVKFTKCSEATNCIIHQVRINPCREAIDDNPCKIKRYHTAVIEFDFSADFETIKPIVEVYWTNLIEIKLSEMVNNACNATSCSIKPNTNQTYTYTMEISKKFPTTNADIKLMLTGDSPTDRCCFITKMRILK